MGISSPLRYQLLLPCQRMSSNFGRSKPGHYTLLFSPTQGQASTNAIHLGTAQVVCDESYMSAAYPDFATAAWLLKDSHFPHQNLCQGITHVPGPPADANVYRAELQGLHALLLAIKDLCSFHAITSVLVVVGCDNLGAFHQAHQIQELTPCSSPMQILSELSANTSSFHTHYKCNLSICIPLQ